MQSRPRATRPIWQRQGSCTGFILSLWMRCCLIQGERLSRKSDPIRTTDPRTNRSRGLGNTMLMCELAGMTHHQQTAGFERDTHRTCPLELATNQHVPRRTQRQDHDRRANDEIVGAIVMDGHAVVAIAIEVQADMGITARHHRFDGGSNLAQLIVWIRCSQGDCGL